MDQHAHRSGDLDPRADDEREERPESDQKCLRHVAAVVEQFAQHGAQKGAEEDAHRREKEESCEDAHRGADGSRARTAEPPGHPGGEEIVGDAYGDGHPEPEPQRRSAHLGVGGEIGAQQARIAQHHARQGGHDAADDAQYREHESEQGERNVHRKLLNNRKYNLNMKKSPFFGEILCFIVPDRPACGCYSTSRLVAVSGKMTHGRNCLASSKSISA